MEQLEVVLYYDVYCADRTGDLSMYIDPPGTFICGVHHRSAV